MKRSHKWSILIGALVVLSLLLAACGQAATTTPEPTSTPTEAPTEEPTPEATLEEATPEEGEEEEGPVPTAATAEGPTPIPFDIAAEFRINGASSVYQITHAIAQLFTQDYPNVEVTVGVAGTAGGFRRFCEGETHINNAARPIFESEADRCEERNVEWIELLIGYEGVILAAHPEMDFATCLTTAQLATIWSADSEPSPEVEATATPAEGAEESEAQPTPNPGITNWSQVAADFPDMEMLLYGDRPDSSAADFLSREVTGTAGYIRTDYTDNSRYQVLVDEMVGKPGSIGFFDFGYYNLNEEELAVIAVDSGRGCVEPSAATIADGTYLLARPLYLYVAADQLDNPAVLAFMDYYLSETGLEQISKNGYFPASEEIYQQDRDAIAERVTGRAFTEPPPEPEPVVTPTATPEATEAGEEGEQQEEQSQTGEAEPEAGATETPVETSDE
jgi:phosphate transport system substrate-binding protein